MSINFEDQLLCFIADCMAVASEMGNNKLEAVKAMATNANTAFSGFESTPARVAEVKSVISAAIA